MQGREADMRSWREARPRLRALTAVAAGLALAGCSLGDDDGGNGGGDGNGDPVLEVVVLNSTGRTLSRFDVQGDELVEVGPPLALGAQFDGDAVDLLNTLFATTVSAQGGSQIIFGDAVSGEMVTVGFPGPDAALVDPSKVTLALTDAGTTVTSFVAGRGSDDIYAASPGVATAEVIAEDVGEFIERVLPANTRVVAVDANLDDDGGTFQPLGDPRVVIVDRFSGDVVGQVELAGAVNATNALFVQQMLWVLAGGGFEMQGGEFVPAADGSMVAVQVQIPAVAGSLALEGNGISLEPGLDGRLYVTRTTDFERIDVLRLNPFSGEWVRGPDDPIRPTDAEGAEIDCWAATALADQRLLCVTFSVAESGRLYLLDREGEYLDDVAAGFGSTDIALR